MKKLIFAFSLTLLFILGACVNASDAKKDGQKVDTLALAETEAVESEGVVTDGPGYKIKDDLFIPESLPMVVDFYADWCPPCQKYKPIFEAAKAKYQGSVIFLSVDVEKNSKIANAYNAKQIPTTAFILPGGGILGSNTGLLSADELDAYINQLVAEVAGEDLSI